MRTMTRVDGVNIVGFAGTSQDHVLGSSWGSGAGTLGKSDSAARKLDEQAGGSSSTGRQPSGGGRRRRHRVCCRAAHAWLSSHPVEGPIPCALLVHFVRQSVFPTHLPCQQSCLHGLRASQHGNYLSVLRPSTICSKSSLVLVVAGAVRAKHTQEHEQGALRSNL